MASEVKTNKVSPSTGTTLSVGDSGDTLALATDAVTGFQVGSDAAGDVLYHDGTDYTRLAKPGTPADEVLTFATGASAPTWVASAAGGMILQVLGVTLNTAISTTSTTYVTSGLSIDITPASTSSRFLLTVSGGMCYNSAVSVDVLTTFYVDGSEVSDTGPYSAHAQSNAASPPAAAPHSAFCLHSPSTTSSTTYAVFYKAQSSTANFNASSNRVQFSVMELSS
jgi:hypothetical protein